LSGQLARALYTPPPPPPARCPPLRARPSKNRGDPATTPGRTCALLAGLSSDDTSVKVDTGLGGSDGSSGSSGSVDSSSGLSDSSSTSDSGGSGASSATKGSGAESASPAPSSGASDASKAPTPEKSDGAGKADGSTPSASAPSKASENPVVPDAGDDSDNSWQTGSSWSLVDTGAVSGGGKHRGDSADETVTNGQKAASAGRHASADAGTYTVRDGDTLASIADSLGLDGGWRALYAANKADIGTDPNNIAPGQTLKLGS
ncbi:LysM peptidoglycan-binding domain-containing protein, partial [Streptomyces sp. NPDC127079]|uniref:LysM peptidoglycan-binding domain-containing protein n=1 Tax=Streptomyces sp. NPDC127079 TaxID=3347132 RepID=UPI00364DAF01